MIGKTITVNSPSNWYNGRKAVVKNEDKFGDVVVLWVAVGNVEFALRDTEVVL